MTTQRGNISASSRNRIFRRAEYGAGFAQKRGCQDAMKPHIQNELIAALRDLDAAGLSRSPAYLRITSALQSLQGWNPLNEARTALFAGIGDEMKVKCPVCSATHAVYKRTLHQGHCTVLLNIHRFTASCGDPDGWLHVKKTMERASVSHSDDWHYLECWGLIERAPSSRKPHSGYWRITPYGIEFLQGLKQAYKHIWECHKRVVRWSSELVVFRDAKVTDFDYNDIFRAV